MLYQNLIVMGGNADNWENALSITGDALRKNNFVKDSFIDACITREKIYPTGLPLEPGVAIPHTDKEHVEQMAICFLRLDSPVDFHRMDDPNSTVPVQIIFNLAVKDPKVQVVFLQKLMDALSDDSFLSSCITLPEKELAPLIYQKIF